MRVLLLSGEHPDLPGLTGGIGSYVADLSRALADRGHDVHVLVCAPGLARSDRRQHGVHLHARGLVRPLGLARGRLPRQVAIAASCRWHARSLGRVDVVESPEWQALAAGFARWPRAPLVITLQTPSALVAQHDPSLPAPTRANDWLERWTVSRADARLSLSQLLVDALRASGWLHPAAEVGVTRPAVRGEEWAVAPAAPAAPRVVGVGRIEPRKGFDLLVRAAALLIPEVPDLRIEIAGAAVGRHGADLDALASELGVALVLHGRLERSELRDVLRGAAAVALPSRFDSFNLAGLEALSAGVPVVVSDQVGLGELADGTEGLQVARRRPEAVAAALRPLLVDARRQHHAAGAARAIADRRSPSALADERVALYRSLR